MRCSTRPGNRAALPALEDRSAITTFRGGDDAGDARPPEHADAEVRTLAGVGRCRQRPGRRDGRARHALNAQLSRRQSGNRDASSRRSRSCSRSSKRRAPPSPPPARAPTSCAARRLTLAEAIRANNVVDGLALRQRWRTGRRQRTLGRDHHSRSATQQSACRRWAVAEQKAIDLRAAGAGRCGGCAGRSAAGRGRASARARQSRERRRQRRCPLARRCAAARCRRRSHAPRRHRRHASPARAARSVIARRGLADRCHAGARRRWSRRSRRGSDACSDRHRACACASHYAAGQEAPQAAHPRARQRDQLRALRLSALDVVAMAPAGDPDARQRAREAPDRALRARVRPAGVPADAVASIDLRAIPRGARR